MSDAFFQLQKTITEVGQLQARLIAENKRLSDENERLRSDLVWLEEGLEELESAFRARQKRAGLAEVACTTQPQYEPEPDPDRLREDAHERQRLEKEYPWKE